VSPRVRVAARGLALLIPRWISIDYNTGTWIDWDSGSQFFSDPYSYCDDGAYRGKGWGYDDIWDTVFFSDWFDESFTYNGYELTNVPNPTIQCSTGFRPVMYVRTADNWIANQWCEALPHPPETYVPLELEAWWDVAGMFFDFALGLGPNQQLYTQGSIQSYQMEQAPGIQAARNFWYNKNQIHIESEQCHNLEPVYHFDVKFGLTGLVNAGGNATQQFVGSFTIDILPHADGSATFFAKNITSMESLLYDLGPSWSRESVPFGIGGDMPEYITWEEQLCGPAS
jgi:hypothetical protein